MGDRNDFNDPPNQRRDRVHYSEPATIARIILQIAAF
jgi:hypothetical protein